MDEYTFEDLIINPETPGLRSLIGREVYYCDVPIYCIRYANDDYSVGTLRDIRKGESAPFKVMTPGGFLLCYSCIILKKEKSKPEYVPFKNAEEFLNAYVHTETKNLDEVQRYLGTPGIWLKFKSTKVGVDIYGIVTDAWDNGLAICNKKRTDGAATFNDTVYWNELWRDYTFLDGTPCGRLKESK